MTERQHDRLVGFRIYVEPKTAERLRILARTHGMSVPILIRRAMQRVLQKNKSQVDEIMKQIAQLDID